MRLPRVSTDLRLQQTPSCAGVALMYERYKIQEAVMQH